MFASTVASTYSVSLFTTQTRINLIYYSDKNQLDSNGFISMFNYIGSVAGAPSNLRRAGFPLMRRITERAEHTTSLRLQKGDSHKPLHVHVHVHL